MIQTGSHLGREVFQTTDHEREVAFGLGLSRAAGADPPAATRAVSSQGGRLELTLSMYGFRKTVDEPTNPASQTRHLPIEMNDLVRHGRAVTRLVNATAYSSLMRCGSFKRART